MKIILRLLETKETRFFFFFLTRGTTVIRSGLGSLGLVSLTSEALL